MITIFYLLLFSCTGNIDFKDQSFFDRDIISDANKSPDELEDQETIEDIQESIEELEQQIETNDQQFAQGIISTLLREVDPKHNRFITSEIKALYKGADVNTVSGESLLTQFLKGDADTISFANFLEWFILEFDPDVNLSNDSNESPLAIAAQLKEPYAFDILSRAGASPNSTNSRNRTAHQLSLANESKNMQLYLLNQASMFLNGDVNSIYFPWVELWQFEFNSFERWYAPIILAAQNNNFLAVKISLLEQRNNLRDRDGKGRTALHLLMDHKDNEGLIDILSSDLIDAESLISDNFIDDNGLPPFLYAIKQGRSEIFNIMLNRILFLGEKIPFPLAIVDGKEQLHSFAGLIARSNSKPILDKILSLEGQTIILGNKKKKFSSFNNRSIWRQLDENNNTVLHTLAIYESFNIAKHILPFVEKERLFKESSSNFANFFADKTFSLIPNNNDDTFIHLLASSSNEEEALEVLKTIFDNGYILIDYEMPNMVGFNKNGYNILQLAARAQNAKILSFFIKSINLDNPFNNLNLEMINATDSRQRLFRRRSALFLALETINPDVVKAALSSDHIRWRNRAVFRRDFFGTSRDSVRNDFFNHFIAYAFGLWGLPYFNGSTMLTHFMDLHRASDEDYFKCLRHIIDAINRNEINSLRDNSNSSSEGTAIDILRIISNRRILYSDPVYLFEPEELLFIIENHAGRRAEFRRTKNSLRGFSASTSIRHSEVDKLFETARNRAAERAEKSLEILRKEIKTRLKNNL